LQIRRLIYTTNAIESLNFQLREVIKTKGHFPSEEAAIKLLLCPQRDDVDKQFALPSYGRSNCPIRVTCTSSSLLHRLRWC
jgi:transposase-like protein